VAEFRPNVVAYDPVVEVVVGDNVNSSGCHRLSSAKRDDWQRIEDGAVTSVNFSAIEKNRGKLTAVKGGHSVRGTMALEDPQAMIAAVQSSEGASQPCHGHWQRCVAFSIC
jgi:hypothetical protein